MAHQRKVIRDALETMLTGTTSALTTYQNRLAAIQKDKLPSLNIVSGPENASARDIAGRTYIRDYEVKIEVTSMDKDGVEDINDNIAKQIEDIISANRSLSGTAMSALYQGSDPTKEIDGELPVGKLTLTYQIKYIA